MCLWHACVLDVLKISENDVAKWAWETVKEAERLLEACPGGDYDLCSLLLEELREAIRSRGVRGCPSTTSRR